MKLIKTFKFLNVTLLLSLSLIVFNCTSESIETSSEEQLKTIEQLEETKEDIVKSETETDTDFNRAGGSSCPSITLLQPIGGNDIYMYIEYVSFTGNYNAVRNMVRNNILTSYPGSATFTTHSLTEDFIVITEDDYLNVANKLCNYNSMNQITNVVYPTTLQICFDSNTTGSDISEVEIFLTTNYDMSHVLDLGNGCYIYALRQCCIGTTVCGDLDTQLPLITFIDTLIQ